MYCWVNIVALLAVYLVHVNFAQYSGCVCFVNIATAVAHQVNHNIPDFPNFSDFSLTKVKFPDFSRFFRCPGDTKSSEILNLDRANAWESKCDYVKEI